MALNQNVPYSPGQIQQSVWDEANNALQVSVVSGGGSSDATAANQLTQISVAEDTLTAIENLEANLLSQSTLQVPVSLDYASTNITTGAYVEIVASCGELVREIEVYNGSSSAMYLAFGAAASEVDQIVVVPGGNGRIPVRIPAATRVSLKAINADAIAGLGFINFYV